MNIVITADKRTDKLGRHTVRLSVNFSGRRFTTSLGHNLTTEQFVALKADVNGEPYDKKSVHKLHKGFVKLIRDFNDLIDWEEQKVLRGEQTVDGIDFGGIFAKLCGRRSKSKTANVTTMNDVFLDFVISEKKRADLAESTVSDLFCFKRKVEQFRPGVKIEDLSKLSTVSAYIEHCIRGGLSNTSAKNQWSYLRWFLRWCYKRGYCGNEFERYSCDLKMTSRREKLVVFLTMEELSAIESLDLDGAIGLAKDIFLFQCYTGLRHSDAVLLRKSDIKDWVMKIHIKKTGTYTENVMNRYAKRIASKYIDQVGETLFPYLNANSTGIYLKKIGKMAGIDEPIRKVEYRNHTKHEVIYKKYELMTTHVGRKTFVVNSLDMGLTATQVIEYTGHSSIQAMEPYIGISRKKKDEAMDVWNTHGPSDEEELLKRRISELTARLKEVQAGHDKED